MVTVILALKLVPGVNPVNACDTVAVGLFWVYVATTNVVAVSIMSIM